MTPSRLRQRPHRRVRPRAWNECDNRVDDDHIHGAGAHEGFCNFKRLFAGVWLRDEQVDNIHTDFGGVAWVKRMFHINKCGGAAEALGFSNDVLAECGFTG